MLRSLLRRRRKPLIISAVVIVYAVILVAWTSGSTPNKPHNPVAAGSSVPSGAPASGSSAPSDAPATGSSAPSGAAASGTRAGSNPGGGPLPLPAFPEDSSINDASGVKHSVLLVVTSDDAILRVGWMVKGQGSQVKSAKGVRSPFRVETVGRGYGAMAALAAQTTSSGTYITCTITVDGRQRVSHTSHGAWSVTTCLG